MSDLTEKFTGFENLVSADHVEIMEALNSLLTALGAPPPGPTTTLIDVVNAIESQTTAQATQHTALMALLTDIFNNTDLIITNNSLNAQLLLNAQYATFCECPTEAPLEAPLLDVTPTEIVDEAKCRRIQFYLSVFGNWLNRVANYGASGATITAGTLTSLLSLVAADAGIVATGAEVGAAAGIPGIVVGAAIGLITTVVYTFGGSVLIDYANQFNDPTLRDNMVQAMYAATNADEGYSAFKTTLLAGMDTIPAEIIYTLWWTAWSNDVYSGSPVVDDSAFDGTICGSPPSPIDPGENCISLTSTTPVTTDDGQTLNAIVWPNFGTNVLPSSVRPPGYPSITASAAIWYNGSNLNGYWVRGTNLSGTGAAGGRMYLTSSGTPLDFSGSYQQITIDTDYVAVIGFTFDLFNFEICAEEPI
jgi:hypothetical protein